ncbi:hypothetical protein [Dactylosporangium sp. NPDC051541]|uniref:hypothetical protein n=1 Tax=Dactylosporangium sp. NPDC051541 TaxID=3363977 RepID=UPI00379C80CF
MTHRAGPLNEFRLSGAGIRNYIDIKRRGRRGLFDLLRRLDGLRLDDLRKPGRPGLEPLLLGHRHIVAIDPAELGGVALFKSPVALFPMHTAKRFHHRAVFPRPGPITHRRRFAFAE